MKPGDRIRLDSHIVTFLRFGVDRARDEHGHVGFREIAYLRDEDKGFIATLPVIYLEGAEVIR